MIFVVAVVASDAWTFKILAVVGSVSIVEISIGVLIEVLIVSVVEADGVVMGVVAAVEVEVRVIDSVAVGVKAVVVVVVAICGAVVDELFVNVEVPILILLVVAVTENLHPQ